VVRLKRVSCSGPGIRRVRSGKGFRYVDAAGTAVKDAETLTRIRELVIPPAWEDVWICAIPNGHVQATGVDARGRRQYRYHDAWRLQRDLEKHDRILDFAARLPAARERMREDLQGDDLTRTRVLACAVRLLDLGFFRIGGEQYAAENSSYGLATLLKEHVSVNREGEITLEFPGKSGKLWQRTLAEPEVCDVVAALKRRRSGGHELLAFKDDAGQWVDVKSTDINGYLREATGGDAPAWVSGRAHTELARLSLARGDRTAAAAQATSAQTLCAKGNDPPCVEQARRLLRSTHGR